MPLSFDFGLWSSFFLSVFLFATLSITIRPFDWYLHNTIHKKKKYIKKLPTDQSIKTANHHRPNDQRGANWQIAKSKAAGEEDRVSFLENNSTFALYLVQAAILAMFTSLVFFLVSFTLSLFTYFLSSLSISLTFISSIFFFVNRLTVYCCCCGCCLVSHTSLVLYICLLSRSYIHLSLYKCNVFFVFIFLRGTSYSAL